MPSATALPSGINGPPTVDRSDNHSGLIVVITSFCLVLVISSLCARAFSSYKRHIIQRDDYGFAAVVVVAIVQISIVLAQVHYGWGMKEATISPRERAAMLKLGYAADILLVLGLGLSKITTAVFYLALFKQKLQAFIQSVLISAIIWSLLSIVLLGVRCSHRPWEDISVRCNGLFARWEAITVIDIILEILLVIHSGAAIYGIRISRRQKIVVFGTLSCRLILIPLAAIHLHYIQAQFDSTSPTLDGAIATITAELYLALSVVCLVASFMKPVLAVYVDEYGIAYTDDTSLAQSKHRSHTSSGSGSRRVGTVDYNHSWQRMLDPPRSSAGNRIVKTVQISVSDGPIELPERKMGEIS